MSADTLSRRTAVLLLAIVIVAWGLNWTVGKAVLHYLPPIWANASMSGLIPAISP